MRFGLLALSLAMLCGGGLAAQSALAITVNATSGIGTAPRPTATAPNGDRGATTVGILTRKEPARFANN